MVRHYYSLTLVLLGLGVLSLQADSTPEDYLTKDGKLKSAIEIRDVQGGFAGFTGTQYAIQADGKWTISRVFNRKLTEQKNGTLKAEELKTIAQALAKYDLKNLKSMGRAMANPHVVTITFGKQKAELTLKAGQPLPGADPATIPGRYSGVVGVVKKLIK